MVRLHVGDAETGQAYDIKAQAVISACGVWVDQFRIADGQPIGREVKAMVAPSQGVHIVVDRSFLPGNQAMLTPKTADGRGLFAMRWLGKTTLGTSDTSPHGLAREPLAFKEDLNFILGKSARYLTKAPARTISKVVGWGCGHWLNQQMRTATTSRAYRVNTPY